MTKQKRCFKLAPTSISIAQYARVFVPGETLQPNVMLHSSLFLYSQVMKQIKYCEYYSRCFRFSV